MNNTLISNALSTILTTFLANTGSEMAKSLGKDIYDKIKRAFTRDDEKKALQKLEAEPFCTANQENLERFITTKLADKEFFQEISFSVKFTSARNFILERVLNSMQEIRTQLPQLYTCLVNSGPDKTGEYHNRIDHLEAELCRFEMKFWAIIHSSIEKNRS